MGEMGGGGRNSKKPVAAPCAKSRSTTLVWPLSAARWRAVAPSAVVVSTKRCSFDGSHALCKGGATAPATATQIQPQSSRNHWMGDTGRAIFLAAKAHGSSLDLLATAADFSEHSTTKRIAQLKYINARAQSRGERSTRFSARPAPPSLPTSTTPALRTRHRSPPKAVRACPAQGPWWS